MSQEPACTTLGLGSLPAGRHIEFIGRIDHTKVKISALSWGDIEAVPNQHPAVRETVVLPERINRRQTLSCHLVPNPQPPCISVGINDRYTGLSPLAQTLLLLGLCQ